jgi:hypothetical protein
MQMKITLSEPGIVAVSPPQYGEDPAGRWWGFFQFPDLWRGNDGALYLAVNIGADSMAGKHEPTQFYASRDGGLTWQRVAREATDRSREIATLPDGRQVAFGQERYLYHHAELSPDSCRASLDVAALGLTPVDGPLRDSYKVNEYLIYRFGDIPAATRRYPLSVRASAAEDWEENTGLLDFPDLRLPVLTRAMWWDEAGREEWKEIPPRLKVPTPHEVTVLPDGTLLWALASQHPDADRIYYRVTCLASHDTGRTWQARGTTADARDTSWGYGLGEQSLARLPDGDLLCVMRTKASNEAGDSHYLAAARSTDGGISWNQPAPLASFSVTPHLLTLANNRVAVVYGRPGVHVKVSADSGRTWGDAVPLVGPTEKELLARPLDEWWAARHDYSCANTSVVVTGSDRFLVAYSDFQHRNTEGQRCKAICVRQVVAGT